MLTAIFTFLLVAITVDHAQPQPVISPDVKFGSKGKIIKETSGELSSREEGEYNGVRYRFYHRDGSGVFGQVDDSARAGLLNSALQPATAATGSTQGFHADLVGWSTACKQDPLGGRRHCLAYKDDLWLFVWDDGDESVLVGTKHMPGSATSISIGKLPPLISTGKGFRGREAKTILEQLFQEPTVSIRYKKSPDNFNIDKQTNTFGAREVYAFLHFGARQPRR